MSVLNQLSAERIHEIAAPLKALECPAPSIDPFISACQNTAHDLDISELTQIAQAQLPSALYLLALLLHETGETDNYGMTSESLDAFLVEGTETRVVRGNLTIDGDLCLTAPLVVTGNLTVSGTYSDVGGESPLVVLGDLNCDAIKTTAWVIVGGNCTVKGYFYGLYNDDAFECLKRIKAKAIISDEHQIEAVGYDVEHKSEGLSVWADEVLDMREQADRDLLRSLHDEELGKVISLEEIAEFE